MNDKSSKTMKSDSSLCFNEKEFMDKSRRSNQVIEDKLSIKNPQMGFPLYPVAIVKPDVLVQAMCNIGFLPYLASKSDSYFFSSSYAKPIKKMKDFQFEKGLPFELVNIGAKLDGKEEFGIIGYEIETREVELRSRDKNYKLLTSLLSIPLVNEYKWKQLCILLSRQYAIYKDRIISHLTKPKRDFDLDVISILQDRSNSELLSYFNDVRTELNNIDNPGYITAFIYGFLSSLSIHNWVPTFPNLVEVGRGQDVGCVLDPHVCAKWKQLLFFEYTDSYYADVLAMHSELDLEMLLSHLFQIVFALDYGQRIAQLVVNNLSVKSLRSVKVKKDSYLYYKWYRHYYRVPTFGYMLKIADLTQASIKLNGVRHSAQGNNLAGASDLPDLKKTLTETKFASSLKHSARENNDENGRSVSNDDATNSFNTDLVRLGFTLKQAIIDKQLKVAAKDECITRAFNDMIKNWMSCARSGEKYGASEDIGWQRYVDIPLTTVCNKALPSAQQEFFDIFRVEKDEIPHGAPVYVLE